MTGRLPAAVAFRAVPDTCRLEAKIGPDGEPMLHLPGHWNLDFLIDRPLARQFAETWFCPGQEFSLPAETRTVVNLCAAPDACELGLMALDRALRPDITVVNHPRGVTMTRRDAAATVFRPLTGLRVPPAVRFVAAGVDAFATAFAAAGFRYPVRVAQEGAHPDDVWLIGRPDDWAALRQKPWGRRTWVMEQSELSGTRWRMMLGIVGRAGRAEVFDADPLPTLERPPAVAPDFVQRLIAAACQCLPLDVWTLVVALDPRGPILDRVFAGLPQPRLTDRTDFDRAARRIALAMKPAVAELVADRAGLRPVQKRPAPVPARTPGRRI